MHKNIKIMFLKVSLNISNESSRAEDSKDGVLVQSGEDLDPSMFE